MEVNDDAYFLTKRSVLRFIASKLRSYKGELITVTAWSIAGYASGYSNTAGSI
ncbi:hypothetical protein M5C90_18155 [Pseudomonas chlororaphis subsp. piscium]|nr:hypothetical protein M5C90_18155 [Pseudomonas chlororaphis subsp. piscium]